MKVDKYIVSSYTYNAAAKTIVVNDVITFDITLLNSVVNETTWDILYSWLNNSEFWGAINRLATVTGSTITLWYDGSVAWMADTDDLTINISNPKQTNASGQEIVDTWLTGLATETTLANIETNTTGLATEATLALIKTNTDNLDAPISGLALETWGNLDTIAWDTTSIDDKLGEVQAIPTANTVLGRLKDIVDAIIRDAFFPTASHKSPFDFTATNTSTTTLTLSDHIDFTDSSQIVYIKYIPLLGTGSGMLVNWHKWVTLTISGNVITVDGAGTPFLAGDKYEVGINYQDKWFSANLDLHKVSVEANAPKKSNKVDHDPIVVTGIGRQSDDLVNVQSKKTFTLHYNKTASADRDLIVRFIWRSSIGWLDHREQEVWPSVGWESTLVNKTYRIDKSAQIGYITVPTNGNMYMRADFSKDLAAGANFTITPTISTEPR